MTSASMQNAIDTILNTPVKTYTKEEAKRNLQACGILNNDGTVSEKYKNIIVKKEMK